MEDEKALTCPKCGMPMEQGCGNPVPNRGPGSRPEYFWASCECGLYQEAATRELLAERLRPAERQEITKDDVGKAEDILEGL